MSSRIREQQQQQQKIKEIAHVAALSMCKDPTARELQIWIWVRSKNQREGNSKPVLKQIQTTTAKKKKILIVHLHHS